MEESAIPKRNIILAAVLAFSVYGLWYMILPKINPQPRAPAQTQPAPAAAPSGISEAKAIGAPASAPAAASEIKPLEFLTDHGRGLINLAEGAALTAFSLSQNGRKEEPALLEGSRFLAGDVPGKEGSAWRVKESAKDRVVLELATENGLYTKEFRFAPAEPGSGILRLEYQTLKGFASQAPIRLSIAANLPMTDRRNPSALFSGYRAKKTLAIRFIKKKQVDIPMTLEGSLPLAALGVAGRYHLAVLSGLDLSAAPMTMAPTQNGQASVTLSLKSGSSIQLPFYTGVKTDHAMESLWLQNLLYDGLLGPLKRLVRVTLRALYKLTHNYGLAIILLTIMFQIVLLPFTIKNFRFSKKMQDLAPRIKQVQEKFKSNPQKMNQEMMELYRQHGTNPLGGCLTMILQMPIFFGLYGALVNSYELYEAPFILWIKNLAAPDPTYILPLLMGGAMFIQTTMTQASTVDPSQKMMKYLMPAMFTFMFLNFPSGLVLYWLVSNVISLSVNLTMRKLA